MRLVLEIEIFIKIILIGKNEKGRKCIRLILLWRIKFLCVYRVHELLDRIFVEIKILIDIILEF